MRSWSDVKQWLREKRLAGLQGREGGRMSEFLLTAVGVWRLVCESAQVRKRPNARDSRTAAQICRGGGSLHVASSGFCAAEAPW